MRILNIVQSVQNFAHMLIFLCVTRAALWRHAFPTFSFLGIPQVVHPSVPELLLLHINYCTKPTKVLIDALGACAHQFERQSSLDGTREQRRRQQILQYCSLERDTPWGRKDFIGRAWRFSKAMPDEWI